jgi:hypothetical protein
MPAGCPRREPMTDPGLRGAVPVTWASGDPAIAASGGTFLDGDLSVTTDDGDGADRLLRVTPRG